MPKFKNQSTLQRIFLGKHDRSLGFADIDIPMLFISTFLLFFGIVMVTSVSLPLTSGSLNMTLSHIQKIFIAFVIALFCNCAAPTEPSEKLTAHLDGFEFWAFLFNRLN